MTLIFLLLLTSVRRKIKVSLCVFSHQELGMMTPQQVMRRRMMPCTPEDTINISGTSAQKTVPPAATLSVSPTHTHLRWTRSGTSIQDSLVHCLSAKQVSVRSCLTIIYSQRGKLNFLGHSGSLHLLCRFRWFQVSSSVVTHENMFFCYSNHSSDWDFNF